MLPDADITCLDYSTDMMRQAREKADRLHLKNVTFRQGDVGALSYADDTFDIVLSLNGFHAFPDFEEACKRANVPYTVSARPKMVHCYCMLPIFKEAKEDFAKIVDILKTGIPEHFSGKLMRLETVV